MTQNSSTALRCKKRLSVCAKITSELYIKIKDETSKNFQATSVLPMPPLRAISNPSVIGEAILDLVPNQFAPMQDDSYLAYMAFDTLVSPSKDNRPDIIWFDDIQQPEGAFINVDTGTVSLDSV